MNTKQRGNLLKLAAYLETLPRNYTHFDMWNYATHKGMCDLPMSSDAYAAKDPQAFLTNCGTAACAAGHGPAAGVPPLKEEFENDGGQIYGFYWNEYIARAFGVEPFGAAFDFLFQSGWKDFDNHHYGAASRIRYFLATGKTHGRFTGVTRKYAPYRKGSRSAVRREIEMAAA